MPFRALGSIEEIARNYFGLAQDAPAGGVSVPASNRANDPSQLISPYPTWMPAERSPYSSAPVSPLFLGPSTAMVVGSADQGLETTTVFPSSAVASFAEETSSHPPMTPSAHAPLRGTMDDRHVATDDPTHRGHHPQAPTRGVADSSRDYGTERMPSTRGAATIPPLKPERKAEETNDRHERRAEAVLPARAATASAAATAVGHRLLKPPLLLYLSSPTGFGWQGGSFESQPLCETATQSSTSHAFACGQTAMPSFTVEEAERRAYLNVMEARCRRAFTVETTHGWSMDTDVNLDDIDITAPDRILCAHLSASFPLNPSFGPFTIAETRTYLSPSPGPGGHDPAVNVGSSASALRHKVGHPTVPHQGNAVSQVRPYTSAAGNNAGGFDRARVPEVLGGATPPSPSRLAHATGASSVRAGPFVRAHPDVLANYVYPPLRCAEASYEGLSVNYKRGLAELMDWVEQHNRRHHHQVNGMAGGDGAMTVMNPDDTDSDGDAVGDEPWGSVRLHTHGGSLCPTAAPPVEAGGSRWDHNSNPMSPPLVDADGSRQTLHAGTIPGVGGAPSLGRRRGRLFSAAAQQGNRELPPLKSLNWLIQQLVHRGERDVALHVVLIAATCECASADDRLVVYYNHIRSCLPTRHIATATLAMEAWGKLHHLGALPTGHVRIAGELLSLATNFLRSGSTCAEYVTALVAVRHVVAWRSLHYGELLHERLPGLLEAIWGVLIADGVSRRIRELAAAAAQDLLTVALERRTVQIIQGFVGRAIQALLRTPTVAFVETDSNATNPVHPSGNNCHSTGAAPAQRPTLVLAGVHGREDSSLPSPSPSCVPHPVSYPTSVNSSDKAAAKSLTCHHSSVTPGLVIPMKPPAPLLAGGDAGVAATVAHTAAPAVRFPSSMGLWHSFKGALKQYLQLAPGETRSAASPSVRPGNRRGGPATYVSPDSMTLPSSGSSAEHNSPFVSHTTTTFAMPCFTLPALNVSSVSCGGDQERLSSSACGAAPPVVGAAGEARGTARRDTLLHGGSLALGAFLCAWHAITVNNPNLSAPSSAPRTSLTGTPVPLSTTGLPGTPADACASQGAPSRADTLDFHQVPVPVAVATHGSSLCASAVIASPLSRQPTAASVDGTAHDDMPRHVATTTTKDTALERKEHYDDLKRPLSPRARDPLRDAPPDAFPSNPSVLWDATVCSVPSNVASPVSSCNGGGCFPLLNVSPGENLSIHLFVPQSAAIRIFLMCSTNHSVSGPPRHAPAKAGLLGGDDGLDVALSRLLPLLVVHFGVYYSTSELATAAQGFINRLVNRLKNKAAMTRRAAGSLGGATGSIMAGAPRGETGAGGDRAAIDPRGPCFSQASGRGRRPFTAALPEEASEDDDDVHTTLDVLTTSLYLAAMSRYAPEVFEVILLTRLYPALCHTLAYGTPTYNSAAFPSLAMLVHNMPSSTCQANCYSLVEHLMEVALNAPFSIERTLVTAKMCAIYEQLVPSAQRHLLRSMEEVLADTPCTRHLPKEWEMLNTATEADGVEAVPREGDTERCAALPEMMERQGVTSLASAQPSQLPPLRPSATPPRVTWLSPSTRDKLQCFTVLNLFKRHWEGASCFFRRVCTPYFSHSNAQLRYRCVQTCVNLMLAECLRSERLDEGVSYDDLTEAEWSDDGGADEVGTFRTFTRPTCCVPRGGHDRVAERGPPDAPRFDDVSGGVYTVHPSAAAHPTHAADGSCHVLFCGRHAGRTHVNTLREMIHKVVDVAVCDPEGLIRFLALTSLGPETDQFLYVHENVVHYLFVALNDAYLPNRVEAVRILRRIAPRHQPLIYPRLRRVLLQLLDDFTSRISGDRSSGRRRGADGAHIPREQQLPFPTERHYHAPAGGLLPTGADGAPYVSPVEIQEEELSLLMEVTHALSQCIPLYRRRILRVLQHVLENPSAGRGAVVVALQLLCLLMDHLLWEEWSLFEPFVLIVARQLTLRDGDTPRMLSALAALQNILQSSEATSCSSASLQSIINHLHSLLYQKPSSCSDCSIAVLKLLGTISSIEPLQPEDNCSVPALLRRPQEQYYLPLYYDVITAVGPTTEQHWETISPDTLAGAISLHYAPDRFSPFTMHQWPDVVLRVLLHTISDFLNGTITLTPGGIGECFQTMTNILRNTAALQHMDVYVPTLIGLVSRLLSRRYRAICAAVRPLLIGNLASLVQKAGARSARMYPLFHHFLLDHWDASGGDVQHCCSLLLVMCKEIPDLVREHGEWWLSRLLASLMACHSLANQRKGSRPPAVASPSFSLDGGSLTSWRAEWMVTYPGALIPPCSMSASCPPLVDVYVTITATMRCFLRIASPTAIRMVCETLPQLFLYSQNRHLSRRRTARMATDARDGAAARVSPPLSPSVRIVPPTASSDLMSDRHEVMVAMINRLLAQVLMDYIGKCDMKTMTTTVVERCLARLGPLVEAHEQALHETAVWVGHTAGHMEAGEYLHQGKPYSPRGTDSERGNTRHSTQPATRSLSDEDSGSGTSRMSLRDQERGEARRRPAVRPLRFATPWLSNEDERPFLESQLHEWRHRCGRQEDGALWYHGSPLMRLVLQSTDCATRVTRCFPFTQVHTSWEASTEMDLLACVLYAVARCRLPSVSYALILSEYLTQRFGAESPVHLFARCAMSPYYEPVLRDAQEVALPDVLHDAIYQPTVVVHMGDDASRAGAATSRAESPQPTRAPADDRPVDTSVRTRSRLLQTTTEGELTRASLDTSDAACCTEEMPGSPHIPIQSRQCRVTAQPLSESGPDISHAHPTHPVHQSTCPSLSQPVSKRHLDDRHASLQHGSAGSAGALYSSSWTPSTTATTATTAFPLCEVKSRLQLDQGPLPSSPLRHPGLRRLLAGGAVSPSDGRDISDETVTESDHSPAVSQRAFLGEPLGDGHGRDDSIARPRHSSGGGDTGSRLCDNGQAHRSPSMECSQSTTRMPSALDNSATEEPTNPLFLFFDSHRCLRPGDWGSWMDQLCLYLVETSPAYCVSVCAPLIKQHKLSIIWSDILPIALLSIMVCLSAGEVKAWLRSIRDVFCIHTSVPQLVVIELTRIAHFVRLYSPTLFSAEFCASVVDVYLPPLFVVTIAQQALNPPLGILYMEQALQKSYTWESMTQLMSALFDVGLGQQGYPLANDPRLLIALQRFLRRGGKGKRGEQGPSKGPPEETLSPLASTSGAPVIHLCDLGKLPPSILELLAFPNAAARRHLEAYPLLAAVAHRQCGNKVDRFGRLSNDQTASPLPGEGVTPEEAIVGAMRCYTRVYNFDAVLQLWRCVQENMAHGHSPHPGMRTSDGEAAKTRTSTASTLGGKSTAVPAMIARYVGLAAKALSCWDVVKEIVVFTEGMEGVSSTSHSERHLPSSRPDLGGMGESVSLEDHNDFLLDKHLALLRAAVYTVEGRYDRAKAALVSIRDSMKDFYTVFHTENFGLKLELHSIFQQLSDLEEGIHAIELSTHPRHTRLSGKDSTPSMPLPGGLLVPPVSPYAPAARDPTSREPNGVSSLHPEGDDSFFAMSQYKEATIRRLKNISCRTFPRNTTVLQRIQMIAMRSLLVAPEWQLRNIFILCEHIEGEGLPMRAAHVLDHFAFSATRGDAGAIRHYRQQLQLERNRHMVRHCVRPADLRELHADITIALRLDVLTCVSAAETLAASRGEGDLPQLLAGTPVASAYKRVSQQTKCHPLSVAELGDTLNDYQAELLLLALACSRRCKELVNSSHVWDTTRQGAGGSPRVVRSPRSYSGVSPMSPLVARRLHRTPHARLEVSVSGRPSPLPSGNTPLTSSQSTVSFPAFPLPSPVGEAFRSGTEDDLAAAEELLRDYYLLEHAISVTKCVPSVWREFGLLLFDICVAMHVEWKSTNDPDTLQNFRQQSAKAISALQQAAQLWHSGAMSAVGGIGTFPTTSRRRQRHARAALPAAHLLVKALHLAIRCEECSDARMPAMRDATRGGHHATCHSDAPPFVNVVGDGDGGQSREMLHAFSALDFTAPMLAQWVSISPVLVAAAVRYRPIYDAIKDMCARSVQVLQQLLFQLLAAFEHDYCTCFPQRRDQEDLSDATFSMGFFFPETSRSIITAATPTFHGDARWGGGGVVGGTPAHGPAVPSRADVAGAESSLPCLSTTGEMRRDAAGSPLLLGTPCHTVGEKTSTYTVCPTATTSPYGCGPRLWSQADHRPGGTCLRDSTHVDFHSRRKPSRPSPTALPVVSYLLQELLPLSRQHRSIITQTAQLRDFVRRPGTKEMELHLGGACKLPAPFWQTPEGFSTVDVVVPEDDDDVTRHDPMGDDRGSGDSLHPRRRPSRASFSSAIAGGLRPTEGGSLQGRDEGREGKRRPLRLGPDTPSVLHVRRRVVGTCAPPFVREEVVTFFLSDGMCWRFHLAVGKLDSAPSGCGATGPPKDGGGNEGVQSAADFRVHGAGGAGESQPPFGVSHHSCEEREADAVASASGGESLSIMPYALMESTMGFLLGHMPFSYLRRPHVLPLDLQLYLTELPDRAMRNATWKTPRSSSVRCYDASAMAEGPVAPCSLFTLQTQYDHRQTRLSAAAGACAALEAEAPPVDETEAHATDTSDQRKYTRVGWAERSSDSCVVRYHWLHAKQYEHLVAKAFDEGETVPLIDFIRALLSQRPRVSSPTVQGAPGSHQFQQQFYLYLADLPRPEEELHKLLQELLKVEDGRIPARSTTGDSGVECGNANDATGDVLRRATAGPSGKSHGRCPQDSAFSLDATLLDKRHDASGGGTSCARQRRLMDVRLAIFRREYRRYENALGEAFATHSVDAARWSDARHCYCCELAEWSVVQYLYGMTHREGGNVFVDTASGHVATHQLGRYAMRPDYQRAEPTGIAHRDAGAPCRSASPGDDAGILRGGGHAASWDALVRLSPDPTVFRLTRCMSKALPVETPFTFFQSQASHTLFEALNYMRDLIGIAAFGVEGLKPFAWRRTAAWHPWSNSCEVRGSGTKWGSGFTPSGTVAPASMNPACPTQRACARDKHSCGGMAPGESAGAPTRLRESEPLRGGSVPSMGAPASGAVRAPEAGAPTQGSSSPVTTGAVGGLPPALLQCHPTTRSSHPTDDLPTPSLDIPLWHRSGEKGTPLLTGRSGSPHAPLSAAASPHAIRDELTAPTDCRTPTRQALDTALLLPPVSLPSSHVEISHLNPVVSAVLPETNLPQGASLFDGGPLPTLPLVTSSSSGSLSFLKYVAPPVLSCDPTLTEPPKVSTLGEVQPCFDTSAFQARLSSVTLRARISDAEEACLDGIMAALKQRQMEQMARLESLWTANRQATGPLPGANDTSSGPLPDSTERCRTSLSAVHSTGAEEEKEGMEEKGQVGHGTCSDYGGGPVLPAQDTGETLARSDPASLSPKTDTLDSPHSYNSTLEFVGRLIAAAVEERNIVGNAEAPHEWLRWAPHW